MTGCDFLWSPCGVVGAVCRAVCGVRTTVWVQSRLGNAQWLVLCGTSCGRVGLVCLFAMRASECAMCGTWLVGVRCFG